jgi:hypothetical protein
MTTFMLSKSPVRGIRRLVCLATLLGAGLVADAPAQSEAEAAAAKCLAIDALVAQGRIEDAIVASREVMLDGAAPLPFRHQMGRQAALLFRKQLKQTEKSDGVLEEMLKLPGSGEQRASILRDLLYNALYSTQPRNPDTAVARAEVLMNDTSAPIAYRAQAVFELVDVLYGERSPEQKARPLPLAEKILALPDLPMADAIRLREKVQRTLQALGKDDAARDQARYIYAATNAPAASRVAACAYLAQSLIETGAYAKASEFLRTPFAFPGLTAQITAKIVESIGRVAVVQDQFDAALAIYREAYTHFKTSEMTNLVTGLSAAVLVDALRFEEAAKLWIDQGRLLDAADVFGSRHSPFGDRARELRLQMLEDEAAPLALRAKAYSSFLTMDRKDVPIATRYVDVFIRANTNAAAAAFVNMLTANGRGTAYFGDYAGGVRCLEWLKPLVKPNSTFKTTICGLNAYAGLGRLDDAVAFAREALGYAGYTPQELYQLKITAAALTLRDPKASVETCTASLAKADADAVKTFPLSAADRATALEFVGTTLLHARLEPAARAVDSLYRNLYVPEPKKCYTVTYSETPITGIDTWNAVAAKVERQLMDRKYGGNLEFLATDVATGNRGEGIGAGAVSAPAKFTELAFICDVNGIHFRFDAADSQARDVEAKLVGAGSYEGYIAPGANQPYICFLVDLQSGKVDFYNTTYETQNHKRIRSEDITLWRGEHRFTDTGYTTYIFLSWDAYADKLPQAGDLWDFENAHWGRSGSFTWNGLKSIHGRSSWGNLAFNIPPKARIAIKRKLIFNALVRYKAEKRTSHHHEGVLDHWLDAEVGDPVFYAACVKPLVVKLDACIPLVKADMSDADVERVFNEAVFGWNNIRHLVADLRRKYLAQSLAH